MSGNIIKFPAKTKPGARGPQSVLLDDYQLIAQGQYWDRPGLLSFDSLRAMVDQTPILNAIVMTRIRQVMRFCSVQTKGVGPGFAIAHVDKTVELDDQQQKSVKLLEGFMTNCGWESDPRKRKKAKRDNLSQFMAKIVRDSLTMDSAPIETEFKRDANLGIDGFYAIDGSTIRLCTEHGYEGDDEIFALQVIQGNVRTAYNYDELIYEVRNPRTDVTACGYGLSETETLIRVVTWMLNAMTYNGSYFDKNSVPRGILHLSGNYSTEDLHAFKRYWAAMVKGVENIWNVPVLVSKDQESKAAFEALNGQLDEMAFSRWLTFLSFYGLRHLRHLARRNFDGVVQRRQVQPVWRRYRGEAVERHRQGPAAAPVLHRECVLRFRDPHVLGPILPALHRPGRGRSEAAIRAAQDGAQGQRGQVPARL